MISIGLFLICGSACLHVMSHVALKRAYDRTSFVWWMWLWASVLCLPVPILFWQQVSPTTWAIMIVSAFFEALYFTSIARAYKIGDLSTVYPLARGTAPLFILVWSISILQESPSLGGVAGITLIIAGSYMLNLAYWGAWRRAWQTLGHPAAGWALLSGVCISLYTTIDKVGVRSLSPLLYTYLAMSLTLVWLTPLTLKAVGWRGLVAEWRQSRLNSVVAGFMAIAAYALVLCAMQTGMPASYAGATREVSVVLGALVGIFLLKEQRSSTRIAGAGLIAFGVVTIALLG